MAPKPTKKVLVKYEGKYGNAKINKPEKMKKVHASVRMAKSTSS
jgi:hypothetical protein